MSYEAGFQLASQRNVGRDQLSQRATPPASMEYPVVSWIMLPSADPGLLKVGEKGGVANILHRTQNAGRDSPGCNAVWPGLYYLGNVWRTRRVHLMTILTSLLVRWPRRSGFAGEAFVLESTMGVLRPHDTVAGFPLPTVVPCMFLAFPRNAFQPKPPRTPPGFPRGWLE
ncbi:hypothetical protein LX32DRAFT_189054 [Colletotrichum zoysiae]|uniref:Uncharacterized protein n=1 Tax=Colletotrichum zoysiae TaxID=1216348 RepID=A0AAD9HQB1_9PEZI|nr:hypothetical protein LX32DRAFT_189054 [Colletotrichum zoysiae]